MSRAPVNVSAEPIAPADVPAFIFGGRARFMVRNRISGEEFRFWVKRVVRRGEDQGKWAVYNITPRYERGLEIGHVYDRDTARLARGWGGRGGEAARVFAWLITHLDDLGPVTVHHECKCCYCGKRLDDEVSKAVGYGPKCAVDHERPFELPVEFVDFRDWTAVEEAQLIARTLNPEIEVFPFRTMVEAQAYVALMTDDGDLSVADAVEMYMENPEEAPAWGAAA